MLLNKWVKTNTLLCKTIKKYQSNNGKTPILHWKNYILNNLQSRKKVPQMISWRFFEPRKKLLYLSHESKDKKGFDSNPSVLITPNLLPIT